MKIVNYKCDRCGAIIDREKHYTLNIRQVDFQDRDAISQLNPFSEVNESKDYCGKCIEEIIQCIEHPQIDCMSFADMLEEHKEPEETEVPEETENPSGGGTDTSCEKKHGNANVDIGKVLALLEQDMSAKEISKMCECGYSTVYYVKKNFYLKNGKVRRRKD